MTDSNSQDASNARTNLPSLHRAAAALHARAFDHHRQAAVLLDNDCEKDACSHAGLARFIAKAALAESEKAFEATTLLQEVPTQDVIEPTQ